MRRSLLQVGNSLGTLVLALLLAFVIWIVANLQGDPFEDKEVANVPVTLANQPEDTVLFEPVVERVAVTVRARRSVTANLKAADFSAILDLAEVQPGVLASLPISVTTANESIRIEAVTPAEQTVHLEAVRTTTLPVKLLVEGEPATGYWLATPEVAPGEVAVSGPVPLLDRLGSAIASIDVSGAREDRLEEVSLALLDTDGQPLTGLAVQPAQVTIRLELRRRLGYKPDVEVVPDLRGEPESGYRLGSVSVDPQTVTLAGIPSVLDQLPSYVETLPISITGATQNLLQRSPLTVPSSVVVVGYDYVTVTVEVLPIQSSRAVTVVVGVQGLPLGWVATASPTVVNVILEGPDPILAGLKPGDLRVTLNLFGLNPGSYRLVPNVLAPEGISVASVIPETIEIVVGIAPTATLSPSLTPEPTATRPP